MVVGKPIQMRNIYLPSNLNFNQSHIKLLTKLKNLGVVFDEKLWDKRRSPFRIKSIESSILFAVKWCLEESFDKVTSPC